MNAHKSKLIQRLPARFPGMAPLPDGWRNHVFGCNTPVKGPGLYMMDVEHVPPRVAEQHNDESSRGSVISLYRGRVCVHNCPSCFNEEITVYGKQSRILTLAETMRVIDSAMAIAAKEGHRFEVVKFLGPGELLMNPELFRIIEEYRKRGIFLNIFTKGALLGDDRLAKRFQGHNGIGCAEDLVACLAGCGNVGLIFSFQSFDPAIQDALVTTRKGSRILGLKGHTSRRDRALELLMSSDFFGSDGTSWRLSLINAPFVPENIDESLGIYIFAIERGMPMVCTPTMISGRGRSQIDRQNVQATWHERIIELYAEIYLYNLRKGIQTMDEIMQEGISPYAGTRPCNQTAVGLYLRANGIVQMCPGRFDAQTIFGNVLHTPLEDIWMDSPNRSRGRDPMMRINNHCPAKDSRSAGQDCLRAFPHGFYERVMESIAEKLKLLQ